MVRLLVQPSGRCFLPPLRWHFRASAATVFASNRVGAVGHHPRARDTFSQRPARPSPYSLREEERPMLRSAASVPASSAVSRRAVLLSGAAILGGWPARLRAAPDQGSGPCATASPAAVIASASEPGPRLLVRGRLFAPDGERPAAGALVYASQTDATGVYNPDRNAPPRLRGYMKTDADGRFEYETIRPGSYPGTRNPAHVHHQAWGGGWPAQWLGDLN